MAHEKITELARAMASEVGLINLCKKDLCRAAGIRPGSFRHVTGVTFGEFVKTLDVPENNAPATRKRAYPALRKNSILQAAVELAVEIGSYAQITRDEVARRAGVSGPLVSNYYGMKQLKNAVVREGIRNEIPEIIAQALVNKHPRVKNISEDLRGATCEHLRRAKTTRTV